MAALYALSNKDRTAAGATTEGDKHEMLSGLYMLRSFFLECTGHGFPKIINTGQYRRRVFWLTCTSACWLMFLVQMTFLAFDFLSYPVSLNFEVVTRQAVQFPTITICNANKLRQSRLRLLPKSHALYKNIYFNSFNDQALSQLLRDLQNISADSTEFQFVDHVSQLNVNATQPCDRNRAPHVLIAPGSTRDYSDYGDYGDYSDFKAREDGLTPTSEMDQREFYCVSTDECTSSLWMCDQEEDCTNGDDELVEYCGGCRKDEFNCRDGSCVDGSKRCDGELDCGDGSDEEAPYCDATQRDPQYFYCCNSLWMVPVEYLCDGIKDCGSDNSDEFLHACVKNINYENSITDDWLPCQKPGSNLYSDSITWIREADMGDGEKDCNVPVDEMCAWKQPATAWENPNEKDEYRQFTEYMELLKANPGKTRWYAMANESEILQFGHQYHNMFITCVFNNYPCSRHLAVLNHLTVSQTYGLCHTFEVQHLVTSIGKKYGLSLLVNLEVYEQMGLLNDESSLKLFLSDPQIRNEDGSLFIDEYNVISLAPGFQHDLKLHPVVSKKMGEPYSLCQYYGEGALTEYKTRYDCETACQSKLAFSSCGCTDDVNFSTKFGVPLCSLGQVEARDCVDDMAAAFDATRQCSCPEPCTTRMYHIFNTQSEWPSNASLVNFFGVISDSMQSVQAKEFVLGTLNNYVQDKQYGTTSALTSARSNFLKVNIFFGDLTETVMVDRPFYTVVNVLGNLGGLMGLYTGLSVLSVLEVLDFMFEVRDYVNLRGMKQRKAETTKKTRARQQQREDARKERVRRRADKRIEEVMRGRLSDARKRIHKRSNVGTPTYPMDMDFL